MCGFHWQQENRIPYTFLQAAYRDRAVRGGQAWWRSRPVRMLLGTSQPVERRAASAQTGVGQAHLCLPLWDSGGAPPLKIQRRRERQVRGHPISLWWPIRLYLLLLPAVDREHWLASALQAVSQSKDMNGIVMVHNRGCFQPKWVNLELTFWLIMSSCAMSQ